MLYRTIKILKFMLSPLILIGSIIVWFWIYSIYDSMLLATFVGQVSLIVPLVIYEWVLPNKKFEKRESGSLITDLIFNSITLFCAVLIPTFILFPIGQFIADLIGTNNLWSFELISSAWSIIIKVVLGLLIVDFTSYWWHRFEHTTSESWMWKLHSVHHGSRHFDVFMGARVHPIDVWIFTLVGYTFLAVLGVDVLTLHLVAFIASMIGAVHHCKAAVDCGFLNRIIPFADHHAIHHSRLANENGNFGNITTIFDQIFGSYISARPNDVPKIGAISLPKSYPQNKVLFLLLSPFGKFWRRAKGFDQ